MKKCLLLIFAFSAISANFQQIPEMDAKDTTAIRKASYIYNFAKLVDWPDSEKKGNFVISVMGGNNLHNELVKKYNSKQIGSQQIEIRKLSKTLNISKCHLLYVGKEYIDMLPAIMEALKDEPTLIVADGKGSLQMGAALNFMVDGSKLAFELKAQNAAKRNVYIGTTLISLAARQE